MDLAQVTQDIESWIENFVEVPHPALGGWAPCPYARRARLDRDFEVRLGQHLASDLLAISSAPLAKSVVILVYDACTYPYDQFHAIVDQANQQHLVPKDLIALEDHPSDAEVVNGVAMNQGTYALILIQNLTDLNAKARQIALKGFYHNWPEQYLEALFKHRQDPRL
jgi:hypothetical protein